MSYFLAASVLAAVILVTYVWWATREYRYFPDDKILDLSSSNNDLLAVWYRTKLPDFQVLEDNESIARRYLQRVHSLTVDDVVVGIDVAERYLQLTGSKLPLWHMGSRTDCYIDLRREVGIAGEVAIVESVELRRRLDSTAEKADLTDLARVIEGEFDLALKDYIVKLLDDRWESIAYPIEVRTGSYLFLPNLDMFERRVTGLKTVNGYRLNLLCTELEFNTLLQRWKR